MFGRTAYASHGKAAETIAPIGIWQISISMLHFRSKVLIRVKTVQAYPFVGLHHKGSNFRSISLKLLNL